MFHRGFLCLVTQLLANCLRQIINIELQPGKTIFQTKDSDYYDDDLNIAQKLIHLSENAENRNIEFNLSFTHFKKELARKFCPYTGRQLTATGQDKKTVERIDSSLGYTDDNVIVISHQANMAKGNLSYKEVKKMYQFLKRYHEKLL